MLWKCCTQYASGHRTGKGQFSFQSQRKTMPKNAQTTTELHSSHILAKWCSKFSKPRLQQYVNHEIPDVQAGFRKGRRTRDQIANIRWIIKNQESSRKTYTFTLLSMPKALTMWITINCGKFLKSWEYQTTSPAFEKSVCRSGSNR